MATTAQTLIDRTRRFLRDYPEQDNLTASVTSNATTITVADGTLFAKNWRLQIGNECLVCTANGSGTTVAVRRAQYGTTGASAANGATILMRPAFLDIEILDAINNAIDAIYPLIYCPVADETLTVTSTAYEYTIPNDAALALPIRAIAEVQYQASTSVGFRRVRNWTINRVATPKIRFSTPFDQGGVLRLIGFGPFPHLAFSGSVHALFPYNAEDLLVYYAAQQLLASGEAGRSRFDVGARDDREAAQRPGTAMGASNALFQRFQIRLQAAAMPPMPKNVVLVF